MNIASIRGLISYNVKKSLDTSLRNKAITKKAYGALLKEAYNVINTLSNDELRGKGIARKVLDSLEVKSGGAYRMPKRNRPNVPPVPRERVENLEIPDDASPLADELDDVVAAQPRVQPDVELGPPVVHNLYDHVLKTVIKKELPERQKRIVKTEKKVIPEIPEYNDKIESFTGKRPPTKMDKRGHARTTLINLSEPPRRRPRQWNNQLHEQYSQDQLIDALTQALSRLNTNPSQLAEAIAAENIQPNVSQSASSAVQAPSDILSTVDPSLLISRNTRPMLARPKPPPRMPPRLHSVMEASPRDAWPRHASDDEAYERLIGAPLMDIPQSQGQSSSSSFGIPVGPSARRQNSSSVGIEASPRPSRIRDTSFELAFPGPHVPHVMSDASQRSTGITPPSRTAEMEDILKKYRKQ